jgi:hypothetical protein
MEYVFIGAHLGIYQAGGVLESQLSQGDEVAYLEEVLDGPLCLVAEIDPALFKALQQVLGRKIDQLYVIRLFHKGVGDCLAHSHARDPGYDIVYAFAVLDIQGRKTLVGLEQFSTSCQRFGCGNQGI